MGQILVADRSAVVIYKDPDEIRDYPFDWTDDLPPGVMISSTEFLPDDPALTVDAATTDGTGTVVRLSEGTERSRTRMTNRATLSDGQVHDFRVTVVVRQG